jgi:hypothetical protein
VENPTSHTSKLLSALEPCLASEQERFMPNSPFDISKGFVRYIERTNHDVSIVKSNPRNRMPKRRRGTLCLAEYHFGWQIYTYLFREVKEEQKEVRALKFFLG